MKIPNNNYPNRGTLEDYMKEKKASRRTIREEEQNLKDFTETVDKSDRLRDNLADAKAEYEEFKGSPEKQEKARLQTKERKMWRGLLGLILILATADVAIVLQNVSHDIAALMAQTEAPSFGLRLVVLLIIEALIIGCLLLFKKLGDPAPFREQRKAARNLAELREAKMGLAGAHFARLVFANLVIAAIGMNIVAEVRKAIRQDQVGKAAVALAEDVTIAVPGVAPETGAPAAAMNAAMNAAGAGGFELPPIPVTAGVMLILLICHIGLLFLPAKSDLRPEAGKTVDKLRKRCQVLRKQLNSRMVELNAAYKEAVRRDQGFSDYYLERLPAALKAELRSNFGDEIPAYGSPTVIEEFPSRINGSRRFSGDGRVGGETLSIS